MKMQIQRTVAALALSLATAVVLVGGAQADRRDNRAGMLGTGGATQATAVPDWFERAAARGDARVVRPDDRAGMLGTGGARQATAVPDWFERAAARADAGIVHPDESAGIRGIGPVASGVVPDVSASPSFNWSDAAVGAGFALMLVLMGGVAAVTVRHRRHIILP